VSADCEFDEGKFKHLLADTNSGEVIAKSHWTEAGDEILYSCNETVLRADFSDFPDERRAGQRDVLLTRNGTPYVHVPENGAIYTNVVQRVTLPGIVDRKYVAYALNHAKRALAGQGIGIESFNLEQWKNLRVPLPHQEKQIEIATFLDRKTAAIDELIDEKRRLIELLEEKRDAVIHHRLACLDEQTVKLGYLVDFLPGYAFSSQEYSQDPDDVRLLRGVNVGIGSLRWNETVYWPRERVGDVEEYLLEAGDLVVGMDRPWISAGFRLAEVQEQDTPCLLLQRVGRIRPGDQIDKDFLKLALRWQRFQNHVEPGTTGIAVPHISGAQILSYEIPLPQVEEQAEISAELSQSLDSIDRAKTLLKNQIQTLEQYRQSLITAAVTGQIDVEDYEADASDDMEPPLRN
jgi:restriction endonuclease S subunit